jgi:spermidine/putrescine transport system substrate-binding protein
MIDRRRLISSAAAAPFVWRRTARAQDQPFLVLGWPGYVDPPLLARFKERTGIDVVFENLGAYDEIFLRLRAGGIGRYAVIAPHHGLAPDLLEAGLIQPLDPNQIPRLAEIDPHFALPDTTELEGARYAAPLIWDTCPTLYNADLLPEPPANWTDLDTDEYTGKVAMLDDSFSHFNLWSRVIGAGAGPALTADEMQRTANILTSLKQNRVSHFTPSSVDLVAQLVNRKALISTTGWAGLTLLPVRAEANIQVAHLAPGDFSFVQALAIPAEAPHVEIAHQFIDFMLTPEEQAGLANRTTRAIVHLAAVPQIDPLISAFTDYAHLDAILALSPILAFPPLGQATSRGATYLDWVLSWERIRTVDSNAAP